MKTLSVVLAVATLVLSAGVASAQTKLCERSQPYGRRADKWFRRWKPDDRRPEQLKSAGWRRPQWSADRAPLRPGEWRSTDEGSQSADAPLIEMGSFGSPFCL